MRLPFFLVAKYKGRDIIQLLEWIKMTIIFRRIGAVIFDETSHFTKLGDDMNGIFQKNC